MYGVNTNSIKGFGVFPWHIEIAPGVMALTVGGRRPDQLICLPHSASSRWERRHTSAGGQGAVDLRHGVPSQYGTVLWGVVPKPLQTSRHQRACEVALRPLGGFATSPPPASSALPATLSLAHCWGGNPVAMRSLGLAAEVHHPAAVDCSFTGGCQCDWYLALHVFHGHAVAHLRGSCLFATPVLRAAAAAHGGLVQTLEVIWYAHTQ
jgi:hypothetical protein